MSFWGSYSRKVKLFVLIPFLIYFCSTVYYLSYYLIDEDFRSSDKSLNETWKTWEFGNRCVTIAGTGYFFIWELGQIIRDGVGTYFLQGWNYLDVASIVLNTFLLCDLHLELDYLNMEDTVLVCFVAVFILWYKLIYWFRLFESTSFYIKLIVETIKSIEYFIIIFVVFLLAFSNAIFILNTNRTDGNDDGDEGSRLLGGELKNGALDSILNQYMLALGEFGTDNFSADSGKNSEVVWALFVFATFITQLTILNMLIAIMGDTFDAVLEKQEQYAMKEKIRILNDFVGIVDFLGRAEEVNFIFAAEPSTKGNDEGESWDGKIGAIKKGIQQNLDAQKNIILKKMSAMQDDIAAIAQSNSRTQQLEGKVDGMIELLNSIKEAQIKSDEDGKGALK